jgi:hypothetical protein
LLRRGLESEKEAGALFLKDRDPGSAFARAEGDYSEVLRRAPDHGLALTRRGDLQALKGQWLQSHKKLPFAAWKAGELDLTRAVELRTDAARAWAWRARLRLYRAQYAYTYKTGDYTTDLDAGLADAAHALSTPSAPISTLRGRIGFFRGYYDHVGKLPSDPRPFWNAAERDLDESLRLDPKQLFALHVRGRIKYLRGTVSGSKGEDPLPDLNAAEVDMGRCIELFQESECYSTRSMIRRARAQRLQELGRPQDAARDIADARSDLRKVSRLRR